MTDRIHYPDPSVPDLTYTLSNGPGVQKQHAKHLGEFTPPWVFEEAKDPRVRREEVANGADALYGTPLLKRTQQMHARRYCEDNQRFEPVVSVLVHFSDGDSMFYKGPLGSWEEVPE